MRIVIVSASLLVAVVLVLTGGRAVSAEMEKVIDETNWQEAEGLIPAQALEWVKRGDFVMKLGTIKFDPVTLLTPWTRESLEENRGKYEINEKNVIIDPVMGKQPRYIKGYPFPAIDPKDPKASVKVMYNGYYARNNNGPLRNVVYLHYVALRGHERDMAGRCFVSPLDGWGGAADMDNPKNIETYFQMIVDEPYDMAGTATMTWRFRDETPDMLYGYVPAIRRVRRLSPANRSDALFGSDFARDDGGYCGYDGKIPDFEWKLLGTADALGAFLSDKPVRCIKNEQGEWVPDVGGAKAVTYVYETSKPWKGAPWHVASAIWVKRPVWVVQGAARDPYYNYGRVILYIDRETSMAYWKEIYDRSDEYWKTLMLHWHFLQSDDRKMSFAAIAVSSVVDERNQHGSHVDSVGPTFSYVCNAKIDMNQYSLGGFTKLCK